MRRYYECVVPLVVCRRLRSEQTILVVCFPHYAFIRPWRRAAGVLYDLRSKRAPHVTAALGAPASLATLYYYTIITGLRPPPVAPVHVNRDA